MSGPAVPTLSEAIGDASNVLVCAPGSGDREDEACGSLVAGGIDAALCITFVGSPRERRAVWRSHAGTEPSALSFIEVGEGDGSEGVLADNGSDQPAVVTLTSPGNLTKVGVELTRFLEGRGGGGRIGICFHSLTALLQYVDVQRAFRFLHVATRRVRRAGAVGHYHVDPSAHDERTMNTLKQVFDAVASLDGNGEWTVSHR